ncbi:hypothetical protein HYALB_00004139 [Hymenoscyphus albidus]|uniref:Uncharacterized protein n=1 Tax=Hymenoscyphus albidus TaxID=595503 RepID=A0A9N9PTD8_9HELO|nr:hypothetical protein HYALB_00004139 [Hymenoscyphus albidus]
MGIAVDWMNMSFEKTWSLKTNFQELLPNSSAEEIKNKQHDGYQELSNWEGLMEYYSNCGITKDSDRLIAISGLAEIVRRKTGLEYFAALFNFQIEEQLLWTVVDRNKCERAHGNTATWAPSWSWASVKGKEDNQGKVRLHNYRGFWSKDSAVTTRVTIVSINVATDEEHPCGKLDMKGDNTLEMREKLTKYYPELGVAASNDRRQFWNVGGVYFDTIDVVPEEAYCFLLLSKTESQRAPNIINECWAGSLWGD